MCISQIALNENYYTIKHAKEALGSVSWLLGRYETRLKTRPELQSVFAPSLTLAETELGHAKTELAKSSPDAAVAEYHLRRAQAILETIRIAVDGDVLVRFFDGSGNEIGVSTRSLVIFVATDVSRFAEAIRQLAEAEEVTRDILMLVVGRRIQEAQLVEKRVTASNAEELALSTFMRSALEELKKATPAAGEESKELMRQLLDLATVVAGQQSPFTGSSEIKGFVEGQGGR